jgi:hypothetical protein
MPLQRYFLSIVKCPIDTPFQYLREKLDIRQLACTEELTPAFRKDVGAYSIR